MTLEIYKNSFITLDDAQLYFEERYKSDAWFTLNDEEKEKLLISASKKINRTDFLGKKKEEGQPMEFPRTYPMPQDIKDAVCEEALAMAENSDNIHLKNQELGISSISLGSGSASYFGTPISEYYSKEARELVIKWAKKGYNIVQQGFKE